MKKTLLGYLNRSENLFLLGFSYIVYSMTYGLAYNNVIYNHDSVSRIYVTDAVGIHLQSGRPMRDIFEIFPAIGTMSSALMYLLTFIMIFLNIFILVKLFDLKDNISRYLVAITCITFPITAIYWGYGNDVWIYSFALAIASLSTYLAAREKYKTVVIAMIVFLATYQAMLSYAVTLYLMYEMYQMCTAKGNLKRFVKGMIAMVIGAIAYYVLIKILIVVTGETMTTYLNADSIGVKSILENLPLTIKFAYKKFFILISGYQPYLMTGIISKVFVGFIVLVLLLLPLLYPKLKIKKNLVLYFASLVLLPIFLQASTIVTNISLYRSEFGMLAFFIFVIIIGYSYNHEPNFKFIRYITLVLIILFAYTNYYAVNEMFTKIIKKNDINENIAATMYMDLQKTTNFTSDDPIAMCGNFSLNDNISWAENDTDYLMNDYLFTAEPNVYWDNLSPGAEIDRYKLEIESIFRTAGYNVSVVDGKCDTDTEYYPKDGYINQRPDGVYEINIGPVEAD